MFLFSCFEVQIFNFVFSSLCVCLVLKVLIMYFNYCPLFSCELARTLLLFIIVLSFLLNMYGIFVGSEVKTAKSILTVFGVHWVERL